MVTTRMASSKPPSSTLPCSLQERSSRHFVLDTTFDSDLPIVGKAISRHFDIKECRTYTKDTAYLSTYRPASRPAWGSRAFRSKTSLLQGKTDDDNDNNNIINNNNNA